MWPFSGIAFFTTEAACRVSESFRFRPESGYLLPWYRVVAGGTLRMRIYYIRSALL